MTMFNFYQPTKIKFGPGRLSELPEIVAAHGARCLLITTSDAALQATHDRAIKLLEDQGIAFTHFDGVEPNPTVEIVQAASQLARDKQADLIVALGGGSVIDTAKAVAFSAFTGLEDWQAIVDKYSDHTVYYPDVEGVLPLISIPTTSGTGSQVTHASVITIGKEKVTFYHPQLFSKETIIDPELMLSLPPRMTACTAFDAFAHSFESYINARASEMSRADSVKGMALVVEYLAKVLADPSNIEYRSKLALADTFGGRALTNSGADAPHPISEVLGGIANVTHGEALAAIYPAFVKYSLDKYAEEFDKIAKIFKKEVGAEDLEGLLKTFIENAGLTRRLGDMVESEEQFDEFLNHPAFDHMPFGDREYFTKIIEEAK